MTKVTAFYLEIMERGDNVKVIALSEVAKCPDVVMWFYDKFMPKIADIRTVQQRNGILSDMEEQFRKCILHEPDNRDMLSKVYQMLKRKCWEVME